MYDANILITASRKNFDQLFVGFHLASSHPIPKFRPFIHPFSLHLNLVYVDEYILIRILPFQLLICQLPFCIQLIYNLGSSSIIWSAFNTNLFTNSILPDLVGVLLYNTHKWMFPFYIIQSHHRQQNNYSKILFLLYITVQNLLTSHDYRYLRLMCITLFSVAERAERRSVVVIVPSMCYISFWLQTSQWAVSWSICSVCCHLHHHMEMKNSITHRRWISNNTTLEMKNPTTS